MVSQQFSIREDLEEIMLSNVLSTMVPHWIRDAFNVLQHLILSVDSLQTGAIDKVTDEQILYEKKYNDHLNGGTRGFTVYDLAHIAEQLKIPVRRPYSITTLLKLLVSKRPRE